MTQFLLVAALCLSLTSFSQERKPVITMDFVKVLHNRHQEALYFYENNWKLYREIAMDKGYIRSYKLLKVSPDSTADFNLVLITEYADSLQAGNGEENFQKIIKKVRPNGPRLLNNLQPKEFRQNLFLKKAETIFSSEHNPATTKNKSLPSKTNR